MINSNLVLYSAVFQQMRHHHLIIHTNVNDIHLLLNSPAGQFGFTTFHSALNQGSNICLLLLFVEAPLTHSSLGFVLQCVTS